MYIDGTDSQMDRQTVGQTNNSASPGYHRLMWRDVVHMTKHTKINFASIGLPPMTLFTVFCLFRHIETHRLGGKYLDFIFSTNYQAFFLLFCVGVGIELWRAATPKPKQGKH